MKKLITFSVICIMAGILLSSCKSNISIAKRHYNDGYYIAHSKGKQTVSSTKEENKVVQLKIRKPVYSVFPQTTQSVPNLYANSTTTNNTTLVASNEKKIAKAISHAITFKPVKHKAVITTNSVMQIKNMHETKKMVSDGGRDGLSLFWLVILIILILWAVGFLAGGFGLGGLINLLLLVALILLILWLLRIV
ncbi:MAG TPA: DUF5670 family protein [Bacteroidia bacterium]|jgi:hypothetical protein|nr:DUF5670 family protein [Bacteroidia bacterium]